MGATQSGQTRTVNVENDSPIGVIDVSDAVVQRLRNSLAKDDGAKQTDQKPSTTETKSSPSPPLPSAIQPASLPKPASSVPSSYPNPAQYSPMALAQQHGGEPTITAIDVRRQKDAELAQNDIYWRRRMQQLEQTLNKTNAIMEKEYSAAVEDVRTRFHNAPPTHQLPPCQDLKALLIACYKSHPGETLHCAEEVRAFTECVGDNRIKKLDQITPDSVAALAASATKAK